MKSDPQLYTSVSRETLTELTKFADAALRWNAKHNLIGSTTELTFWHRHIDDSLQLLPYLRGHQILDIGTGAGFPGLVLAFALKGQMSCHVHLVEPNRKRASFLATMVGQFGLDAQIHSTKLELLWPQLQSVSTITARAVAPLPVLLSMAFPWLNSGSKALFHKGRGYEAELEEASLHWHFDVIHHRSTTDPDSVILEIWNVESVA